MSEDLTLHQLRNANVERCEGAFHPIEAWSLTDWACAAAGEMGETCNVVKKLRRLDINSGFSRQTEQWDPHGLFTDLGDEIADTVIYLDLLAARAGINLSDAVRAKFNAVSERIGSGVKL